MSSRQAAKLGAAEPLKLKVDEVVTRSFLIEKGIDASSAGALYLESGNVYPVPAKSRLQVMGHPL